MFGVELVWSSQHRTTACVQQSKKTGYGERKKKCDHTLCLFQETWRVSDTVQTKTEWKHETKEANLSFSATVLPLSLLPCVINIWHKWLTNILEQITIYLRDSYYYYILFAALIIFVGIILGGNIQISICSCKQNHDEQLTLQSGRRAASHSLC